MFSFSFLDDAPPKDPTRFRVLVVCSGNIARSPLAEQLLRSRLPGAGGVVVTSAGTIADDGRAMAPEAAALAARYGGDPRGHAAKRLDEELIRDADLVLTATREHRAAVVQMVPRASRTAYTINQFARLLGSLDPGVIAGAPSVEALVAEVAAQRGMVPPPADPTVDDIVDPYRKSAEVYEDAGGQIDRATDAIARALSQPASLR
jgi:protein-tyrosine phosphatase